VLPEKPELEGGPNIRLNTSLAIGVFKKKRWPLNWTPFAGVASDNPNITDRGVESRKNTPAGVMETWRGGENVPLT